MNGPTDGWRSKPADTVVRRPRAEQLRPVRIEVAPTRVRRFSLSAPLVLVYAFGALVSIGTLLLILPFAHQGDGLAPFVDALFTATSAATVTGLITQETSSFWTIPGQFVIMALMFVGGLGVMTIVAALFVAAGRRVSLTQRLVMRETIGTAALADIRRLTIRIVLWAVAIQAAGFVVLFIRFASLYGSSEAVWHALFQAISGFNNAGFTSLPASDNLSAFGTDMVVVGSIAVLVLLGSLSYLVISDVMRRRRFSRLTLNTKLVLVFTGLLLLAGAAIFFLSESRNDSTIGGLPVIDQLVTSVFHSVNRTAGFSTVDFGRTGDQTNFFYMALMFIGGASGSVAGGIKVNTFALVVLATLASLRGKTGETAFGRRVPNTQIRWAHVIAIVFLVGIYLVALALEFIEGQYRFVDLLFEAVSAFGTVGLSTGITGDLSTASQVLLAVVMFIGRVVPPMVIVAALSQKEEDRGLRHPKERVALG